MRLRYYMTVYIMLLLICASGFAAGSVWDRYHDNCRALLRASDDVMADLKAIEVFSPA